MDPLSVIASVLTLTEALLHGLRVLQQVRNAHSDVRSVVGELEQFHSVFRQTEEVLSRPGVFSGLSEQAKEALSLIATSAEAELRRSSQLLTKVAGSNDGVIDIHYTAWLRYGKDIRKGCARLRELQDSLVLVSGTVALASNSVIRQTLDRLEDGLLSELYGTTLHNEKLLEGIACQQLMLIEGLVGSSKSIEGGHGQKPIISSTALAGFPVPNNQDPSSSVVPVPWYLPSPPERMLAIEKCHGVCTCMCHRPSKTVTPTVLSPLLGQAHIRYTAAAQSGRLCNERLCRRQRGYELRLNYKLPSWLASRVLSLSVTSLSDGFGIVLRAPRIVSDDAPILRFAAARDLQSIQSLIGRGLASPADVGHSYGLTALHIAFVNKDIQMCRFLMQHGADAYYETSLRRSVVDIVRDEVINSKVKPSDKDHFDTIFADLDDYESFQFSVVHKSVLGISGIGLPAQLAASTAAIDAPDSLGRTSLSAAAWRGDAAAVDLLLRHGANPGICTPTEISPLHRAIEGRNYACVVLLVEHGADVGHANVRGRTPLHYACRVDDGGEVCALLLSGSSSSVADVDAQDHGGGRAIHEAVGRGLLPQLRLLLERGADVDCCTRSGDFPLKLAVARSDVASARALLDAGADPRVGGGSLLLTAASCADARMLGFLAENVWGMDAAVRDQEGNTWESLFRARGDESTEEMAEGLRRMCRRAEEMEKAVDGVSV